MGPLTGVRVLDLSEDVAGSFCTKLLASFGAEVTKVEPVMGDRVRRLGPLTVDSDGREHSSLFLYLNTGKRGIAVDLQCDEGAALVRRLASNADVIVQSSGGDVLPPDPRSADSLAKAAPQALVVAVNLHGPDGPAVRRRSSDLLAYAESGWASQNGEAGLPPLKGSGYQASFQGGIATFMTVLGGLLQRQQNKDRGRGLAEVSVVDALIVTFAPALLQVQLNGRDSSRRGPGFPSGPVPAKDGYFVLTTSRAHFWRDAMNELGLPGLAVDERFNDPVARQELYAEVAPLVEERIGQRGRHELFHALGTIRVSGGMVLEMDELFDDPQLCERGFFEAVETPGFGTLRYPGAPFKLPASPWNTRSSAPSLGQDTDSVLRKAGSTESEIADLRERGVVA